MGFRAFLSVALGALAAPTLCAPAGPANSIGDLANRIAHCLVLPVPGDLAVHLTLSREGALLGTPHFDYSKMPFGAERQRRTIEMLEAALDRCLPVQITPALGRSIAGRALILRFTIKQREIEI